MASGGGMSDSKSMGLSAGSAGLLALGTGATAAAAGGQPAGQPHPSRGFVQPKDVQSSKLRFVSRPQEVVGTCEPPHQTVKSIPFTVEPDKETILHQSDAWRTAKWDEKYPAGKNLMTYDMMPGEIAMDTSDLPRYEHRTSAKLNHMFARTTYNGMTAIEASMCRMIGVVQAGFNTSNTVDGIDATVMKLARTTIPNRSPSTSFYTGQLISFRPPAVIAAGDSGMDVIPVYRARSNAGQPDRFLPEPYLISAPVIQSCYALITKEHPWVYDGVTFSGQASMYLGQAPLKRAIDRKDANETITDVQASIESNLRKSMIPLEVLRSQPVTNSITMHHILTMVASHPKIISRPLAFLPVMCSYIERCKNSSHDGSGSPQSSFSDVDNVVALIKALDDDKLPETLYAGTQTPLRTLEEASVGGVAVTSANGKKIAGAEAGRDLAITQVLLDSARTLMNFTSSMTYDTCAVTQTSAFAMSLNNSAPGGSMDLFVFA